MQRCPPVAILDAWRGLPRRHIAHPRTSTFAHRSEETLMWYSLLDTQRRLANAFADNALNVCGWAGPAWVPSLPHAARDWLSRSTCAFATAPPFAIAAVQCNGRRIPVEEDVVDETPVGTLRRFTRTSARRAKARSAPVLLCAPLAGHHAVMLRETVEALLETRPAVYITDWADARDVPLEAGPLALADYVNAVERFILQVAAAGMPAHVMAVCQGCIPALAAASLLAASKGGCLASITLLGGPIDTRRHATSMDRFAHSHTLRWFSDTTIDKVPPPYRGMGRRVYPGYLQQAALLAAHPSRQLELEARYWSNWLAGDSCGAQAALRSLNEYAAVLDMSECYFLDMLRVVFKHHLLARGVWSIGGRHVDTAALKHVPLCTIEGDRDHITGAGQTHCAHALCHAADAPQQRQVTVNQCDHYDLFTGLRWRSAVCPLLCEFWDSVEHISAMRTEPDAALDVAHRNEV